MHTDRAEVTVRRMPDAIVLDLRGQIDAGADDALHGAVQMALNDALGGDARRLVLNFSDVEYMNSTGIALVVGILARARAAGTAVGAYGLSDHYREIFRITRLVDFMPIFEDETGARSGHEAA